MSEKDRNLLEKYVSIQVGDQGMDLQSPKYFRTRIIEHLGTYKRNILRISEKYKRGDHLYDHILKKERYELNIIENYRKDFFESEYKSIKLHQSFHHLNSSQAMCINFFYPLIKESLLEEVLSIMGIKGEINYHLNYVCFEKESELEKGPTRKTNFDFYIKLKSGIKLYFEIKYTEREFGAANIDDEHKKKFHDTYLPILIRHPAIKKEFKMEDLFLKRYQLMRNLIHIDKDSYVIFIYPRENMGIRKNALSAKKEMLESGWKNHFILFTWENLIDELTLRLQSKELIDYYKKDFYNKYLTY